MKILLTEWAARNYSPPPTTRLLKAWVRTGQIYPSPERVGRTWMVDEKSTRMPITEFHNVDKLSERALSILKSI